MAGGKGTRLYPYTKILPKPLIPIGDTPILERILNRFVEFGVNKFYLTVNYKKKMIRSYFEEVNPDYDIIYVEEDKPLGTGGSIKLIRQKFDKPIIIANCDAIINADYKDLYNFHIKSGNAITISILFKKYHNTLWGFKNKGKWWFNKNGRKTKTLLFILILECILLIQRLLSLFQMIKCII